ncbi:hypothetical protein BaRGS_00024290 [Batillaria attramentaria]|uniref:Uncharacterized protein n=1 Tax=Batillaria attramentaria TaxID=370345 RepID=A0ABD0KBC9_9CAEN
MFIAGYFGYKASLANVESEVPRFVKRNITVHYVLCVTCCSFCALAASFAGWALALCFQDNEDLRDQCLPVRDVKMAFTISDIVLNTFLTVISIIGTVFFCKYMRTFGLGNLVNRFQQLEREVQDLRAQLAVASSQAPTENRNQVHPLSSTTGGKPGEKNLFVEYGIIDKTAY